MAYHLRGFIVADEWKDFYDWCGYSATCPKDIRAWLDSDDDDRTVTINSYGGDLFAAAEIFHDIANKVDTEIVGLAASAAGIVAMAGKTVKMSSLGEIMIHNVSTRAGGDYRDMEQAAEELRKANETVRAAYKAKTDISDDEIQAMMDAETWLTAKEAKRYGFVDEILHEAKHDKGNLKNAWQPAMAFFNSLTVPQETKPNFSNPFQPTSPKAPAAKNDTEGAFVLANARLQIEKLRFGGKIE